MLKNDNQIAVNTVNYRDSKGRFTIGNPGRRPGTISLLSIIKRDLKEQLVDGKGNIRTKAEALCEVIIGKALAGDFKFIKLIWLMIDGYPKRNAEIEQDAYPEKVIIEIVNPEIDPDRKDGEG